LPLTVKLSLVMVFLALLAGMSFWVIRSFLNQPDKTVAVQDYVPPVAAKSASPAKQTVAGGVSEPAFIGKVVDSKTGRPIEDFTITIGFQMQADGPVTYPVNSSQHFHGGQYDYRSSGLRIRGRLDGYVIRVDADGHYSQISPSLRYAGRQDFSLAPGPDLHGRVLSANGKPVAEATVLIADAQMSLQIDDGQVPLGRAKYQTDAQGRFSLPPQRDAFAIAVACDQGYAIADPDQFAHSTDLLLTPWGRVEGTMLIHGKPAANARLSGELTDVTRTFGVPRIYFSISASTDGSGRFHVDLAPAGQLLLSGLARILAVPPDVYALRRESLQSITVAAGQTLNVTVQDESRSVIGRFVIPGELAGASNWRIHGQLIPKAATMERAAHSVLVQPDGAFLISSVQPGDYQILGSIRQNGTARLGPLAVGWAEFTVPQTGADQPPLRIPDVAITYYKTLAAGDAAPPIATTTLDGQALNLGDYHGKYVLLIFWAGGMNKSLADALKDTYANFGKHDRFTMIGMSFGVMPQDMAGIVRANELNWAQCVVMPGAEAITIATAYGIINPPNVWLIGPDGKVLARDMKADQIKAAVAAALGG
jgi:peroxiredoxin